MTKKNQKPKNPQQIMAVPTLGCCRSERLWGYGILHKFYGHFFPSPLSPSMNLSLPEWQLNVPPVGEIASKDYEWSLCFWETLVPWWPGDQLNGGFTVTPWDLEILLKEVCMCNIWEGESEVFRGPGNLLVAPQLADEIKTPATGKVRATDNWKYWHGAQRPLGWIRTRWVTGWPLPAVHLDN